ncbi:TetR/AcrR family transcriptional regulator [Myceligenerans pegani]|nr:TetR/AcrR family transcriptional regulator [Myceligenerans sp. TRM 65318]
MPRTTTRRRRTPNPATPAGERVLAVAAELFYAHGIRAIGVDRIADEAGVTKKTLYDRFGSKDALVAAYLGRREEVWQKHLHARLAASGTSGAERLLLVLGIASDWADKNERGCAFVNAHAEIGGTDHPGNAVIRADKEYMLRLFVDLAREALSGERPGSAGPGDAGPGGAGRGECDAGAGRPDDGGPDPETIGRQIHLLYEGALTAHTTGVQPNAFATARSAAAALLAR